MKIYLPGTPYLNQKEVLSTYRTNQFIIPGQWLDHVLIRREAMEAKRAAEKKFQITNQRSSLIGGTVS